MYRILWKVNRYVEYIGYNNNQDKAFSYKFNSIHIKIAAPLFQILKHFQGSHQILKHVQGSHQILKHFPPALKLFSLRRHKVLLRPCVEMTMTTLLSNCDKISCWQKYFTHKPGASSHRASFQNVSCFLCWCFQMIPSRFLFLVWPQRPFAAFLYFVPSIQSPRRWV